MIDISDEPTPETLEKSTLLYRMSGTIKTIRSDRGFGFIAAKDGKEYFFHYTDLVDVSLADLDEGAEMTFDVDPASAKGPRARQVRLA